MQWENVGTGENILDSHQKWRLYSWHWQFSATLASHFPRPSRLPGQAMAETYSIFLLQCVVEMPQIQAVDVKHFTLWMESAIVLVCVLPEMRRLPFTTKDGLASKTEDCDGIWLKVRKGILFNSYNVVSLESLDVWTWSNKNSLKLWRMLSISGSVFRAHVFYDFIWRHLDRGQRGGYCLIIITWFYYKVKMFDLEVTRISCSSERSFRC